MSGSRRRRGPATRPPRAKRRHTAAEKPDEKPRQRKRRSDSRATVERTAPDAVELAALEYAKELPAMLRRAMKRAARGKPSPLLRSAPRLIREAAALLDMQDEKRQRKPRAHPQLGVLSDLEQTLCQNLLTTLRGQRTPLPTDPDPDPDPPPLPAPLTREHEPAPPQPPAPPAPPYSGPNRRVKEIPSNVFLGKLERRRR